MADINNITSKAELLEVIDLYLKTPKRPGLNGAELNVILKKVIEFGGGNADAGTVETFFSDLTVGNINAGDQVSVGTLATISASIKKMLQKTFYPVLNDPSFSVSHNMGAFREVGETVNVQLTFNFNRGSIVGKTVNGVWQTGTQQDFRAGTATSYQFLGSINQVGNQYTKNNHVVIEGNNTFNANVTYGVGPQPVDSKGVNYGVPFAAGTSASQSTTFEGGFPYYFGVSDDNIVNAVKILAGTKIVSKIGSGSINVTFGAGTKFLWFAVPAGSKTFTTWNRSALDNGGIGGSGLFASKITVSITSPLGWTKNYDVYITNYATDAAPATTLN